jgi:hypothetical protein
MLRSNLTIAVLAVALTALIVTFLAADAGSHSVSDTLYAWVVPAGLVAVTAVAALFVIRNTRRG